MTLHPFFAAVIVVVAAVDLVLLPSLLLLLLLLLYLYLFTPVPHIARFLHIIYCLQHVNSSSGHAHILKHFRGSHTS